MTTANVTAAARLAAAQAKLAAANSALDRFALTMSRAGRITTPEQEARAVARGEELVAACVAADAEVSAARRAIATR